MHYRTTFITHCRNKNSKVRVDSNITQWLLYGRDEYPTLWGSLIRIGSLVTAHCPGPALQTDEEVWLSRWGGGQLAGCW